MNNDVQQYFSNMWRLRRVMVGRFQAVSTTIGLSPVQGEIIMLLLKSEKPNNAKSIAAILRISPGAVSQQLDSLEKLGCVTRAPDKSDRRAHHIEVNQDDPKILHLRAFLADISQEIASGLTKQELDAMIQGQQKLLILMTKERDTQ